MPTTRFTADHERVRARLRAYVDERIRPQAEEWDRAGDFPDEAMRELGEAGFLGLRYPQRYGGYGGDYYHTVVQAEEMARSGSGSFSMAVSVQTDMATPPIAEFGTEAQKEEFLAPAIRGEKIACLGITEPGAGSDVAGIRTHAQGVGGDWVVNGSKIFITNGARAAFCTLVAKTDRDAKHQGVTLFLLPMDASGVQVSRRLEKVGMWASDTAELAFTDVRLPRDAILGEEGKGFYHIMWELQGERLIAAVESAAGAAYGIERIVEIAQQRRVGGRCLADHDWVRYRVAETAARVEATRQLVYLTADRFDRGEYPVREISMAKLAGMSVAWEVADLGVEVAGEWGIWYGLPLQRSWRDARLGRIGGGTDEVMREVVGKMMNL